MGKTETIKDRRVDVYVDTLERKRRWTSRAEEADESLSKFVQRSVEYAIEHGGPDFSELGERSKQIQDLEAQVRELRKSIKQKNVVIEKLEEDLQQYRMGPFLDEDFEGVRQFDEELIEILKSTDRITSRDLIRRLDVDPNQTEVMQAIDQQLQQLESYGLVANTSGGWRWLG